MFMLYAVTTLFIWRPPISFTRKFASPLHSVAGIPILKPRRGVKGCISFGRKRNKSSEILQAQDFVSLRN